MSPTPPTGTSVPSRYSIAELREFRELLNAKLATALEDLRMARESLLRSGNNGTDDTYFVGHSLEDGSASMEREELMMLAARQEKFVAQLQQALARLRAGNYGVCQATGQLIPKDRLRAVPHATMCIAAKETRGRAAA